jgi:hypothetical protein
MASEARGDAAVGVGMLSVDPWMEGGEPGVREEIVECS